MRPDPAIVCVECGGTARLLREIPDGVELDADDVVAYRCPDCWDRFDVVVGDVGDVADGGSDVAGGG